MKDPLPRWMDDSFHHVAEVVHSNDSDEKMIDRSSNFSLYNRCHSIILYVSSLFNATTAVDIFSKTSMSNFGSKEILLCSSILYYIPPFEAV